MDEIKNIGYIYKITNKINSKCYIGQTSKFYKKRWNEHKNAAFNKFKISYNYPLYKAFRKYGIDNFKFEVIEKCEIQKLNEREIYWISYYNSYKEGYNQDLGGEGKRLLNLDSKQIIDDYKKLGNMQKVADKYNCSNSSIKDILLKNNVKIKSAVEINKEKAPEIRQLDNNHNLIKIHNSLIDAGKWLVENLNLDIKNPPFVATRYAIINKTLSYGYYWESDFYNDKLDELKEKINEYNKDYYKKNLKRIEEKRKSNQCEICGKSIDPRNTLCLNCEAKRRREKDIREKEEKGITREFLKQEIRIKPFSQISKEQNVSSTAISKWCKKFDLPYTKKEIKKYTDEEWGKI
ncbi:GIY-YIG nuclease family protein [Thomasclavelia cocleata]|uniref:GIY-YIG nuclease family protein n=1 Tax=Thomasclavelia cocleata TaxID=69824 RepID=UPI00256F5E70|nr:GIY-YIG nuclease family protein [Thomasclavelia cocleata]